MTELIFEKKAQTPRCRENKSLNMYDGYYKFSTQNTAVYSDFAFIETEDEVMKLSISCDRIFYRKGVIGILEGNKLKLYKNKEYLRSCDAARNENMNDISTSLEEEIKKTGKDEWIFYAGDDPLTVDSRKITFCGRAYINEIHEDGCKYFVAWKQGIAILGNNKSLNLVYFCDKRRIEPDECFPICFRTDEETFDPIMIEDLKFYKDTLLAIDADQVVTYSIKNYKLQDDTTGKILNEYSIKDNKISKREAADKPANECYTEDCNISKDISDDLKASTENKEDQMNSEEKKAIEMGLYLNDKNNDPLKNAKGLQAQDKTKNLSLESFSCSIAQLPGEKSKNESSAPQFDFIKSSIDLSKKDSRPQDKIYGQVDPKNATTSCVFKDLQSSPAEKREETISSFSSSNTLSFAISEKRASGMAGLKNTKILSELDDPSKKFSESFSVRLENLKNSFGRFGCKVPDIPNFKFLESKYDLSELYNCISNNNVENYTKALSSIIIRLEALMATDYRNIEETITFFDSKILQIRDISPSVSYSHPLCPRFSKSVNITDQVTNFIKSFKILKIQAAPDKNADLPIPDFASNVGNTDADQVSEPKKSGVQPENHTFMPASKPSEAPNTFGSAPSPFGNFSQVSSAYSPVDTESLFKSVASNELRTDLIRDINTTPSSTPPDQNGVQPVSAFNKFAGSRRLFK